MKISLITISILLALAIISLDGAFKAVRLRDRHIAEQQEALDRVPSFKELQKMVGAKPDGKICKMWNVPGHSETLEKWERKICDQYAIEAIEKMAK